MTANSTTINSYKAAAYLRLSDKDKHLDSHEQSESIENQKAIILAYLERNPEIELIDFFVDDGYTGLNYERDGFKEMMDRINNGEINMIITKELSRLGREHAETIHLFKNVFPMKKIRYVAVIDNIDFNGRIEGIDIPFKVLMNDYYSATISNSVTNTNRNLQRQGKYIAAFTPYGYKKDPENKHHLIVDEEAANNVRRIYAYYSEGKSIDWICRELTANKELVPAEYKKKYTNYKVKKTFAKTAYWNYTSVYKILKDETYLGSVVQHRREKVAYNLNNFQKVPENEIIKVENMHEAIISKDEFEFVQMLMRNKRRLRGQEKEHPNIFSGIFICGDCGRSMGRVKDHHYDRWYYRCNTYARMGKNYCTSHKIYEETVKEMVLKVIRENVLETDVFKKTKWNPEDLYGKTCKKNTDMLARYMQRMETIEHERSNMLSKLAKEIITEEDYLLYRKKYEEEKGQLTYKSACLKKQMEEDIILSRKYQNWVDKFIVHKELDSLTRDIAINLVEKIIIYENKTVEIRFKFENPFK